MFPFATPDGWSINETAVQNEPLDDSTSMESDKIVNHLIKQRAFIRVACDHTQTGIEEEFSGPVRVD